MNTERSQLHHTVAPSSAAARGAAPARRAVVSVLAFAVAALTTVVADRAASASPLAEVGPAVTVTGSATPGEAAYVTDVRDQLDRAKRYPTGREASLSRPRGTAAVWVDVARDGRTVDRGLARSSGSGLLDSMATALVGRKRYAAFPTDAWSDAATHRFVVRYRFVGSVDDGGAGATQVSVDE
jgi:periplasmic protein TonB